MSREWWVYVNGTAISYYPTSIYNKGAMASYATSIDYGGEANLAGIFHARPRQIFRECPRHKEPKPL
ncbi:MAG: neprosin family prolyl endopeptidase [Rhizonema sp. PD37]|nr:neprosin family prolyl endopeptidase [Rhizonema sp. PD37]